jgi:hypothetical protein
VLQQGETQASLLELRVELPKDFFSGNALNLPGINLPSATLDFLKPRCFDIAIRRAVEFLKEATKNLLLLRHAKLADLLLNYGNWTSHVENSSNAQRPMQRRGFTMTAND